MVLNQGFNLIKSPPVWFWIMVFLISFSGMFYLGIEPSAITNMSKKVTLPDKADFFEIVLIYISLRWYLLLILFNVVMSLVAVFYIVVNLVKLKRKADSEIIGSKFTWSFLRIIPVLTLVPMLSFYFFSFGSIKDNIEEIDKKFKNFNIEVVGEIEELGRSANVLLSKYFVTRTTNIRDFLTIIAESQKGIAAERLVIQGVACSIYLFDSEMNVVASAKTDEDCHPNKYSSKTETGSIIVQFENDIDVANLSNRVEDWKAKAKDSKFVVAANIITPRFILDFSATVLLTLLSALLVVFKMIDDLMRPLHNLSLATREISKGNYDVLVENQNDAGDVGGLIEHFNEMSNRIKLSREGLDTHNLYLETILKYSYGVIGLDKDRKIRLINPLIEKILSIENKDAYIGMDCKEMLVKHPYLSSLFELTDYKFRQKISEWNEELELQLPKKNVLLNCQGAILKAEWGVLGYVIVIDDISELHRAQRSAAWGEVAVRMAHEIKNPLTPILLSAQRLRNRFLETLKGKDLDVIDKTTSTIIERVKSMDIMVSSFADYANSPEIVTKLTDLNALIRKSVSLYDVVSDANINLHLSDSIPNILLDSSSIDRVIINLIKNSCEAIEVGKHMEIDITTEHLNKENKVLLKIEDDGVGFDDSVVDKVFDPYITTKQEGTGLGMAIVHNIIREHGASIAASNKEPRGARIVIEFNCKKLK